MLVPLLFVGLCASTQAMDDVTRAKRKVPGSHIRGGSVSESIALM